VLALNYKTTTAVISITNATSLAYALQVVGLANAYHGDTLGAMDCVPPSPFNGPAQAPWYRGRGLFFEPPYVAMEQGECVYMCSCACMCVCECVCAREEESLGLEGVGKRGNWVKKRKDWWRDVYE